MDSRKEAIEVASKAHQTAVLKAKQAVAWKVFRWAARMVSEKAVLMVVLKAIESVGL